MRDPTDAVLYVGKAKNLRRRLRSYRVANADRIPRRHLRLLRQVTRIDFDLCASEAEALAREATLLRELRPKFNRAGVWPGKPRFLAWRFAGDAVEFSVEELPPLGWERFGPLGAYAPRLLGSVVRLVWLALDADHAFSRLPHGWAKNRFALPVTLLFGARATEARRGLAPLGRGGIEEFAAWVTSTVGSNPCRFDQTAAQADVDEIESFVVAYRRRESRGRCDACWTRPSSD
jgi:hypothetical protein